MIDQLQQSQRLHMERESQNDENSQNKLDFSNS